MWVCIKRIKCMAAATNKGSAFYLSCTRSLIYPTCSCLHVNKESPVFHRALSSWFNNQSKEVANKTQPISRLMYLSGATGTRSITENEQRLWENPVILSSVRWQQLGVRVGGCLEAHIFHIFLPHPFSWITKFLLLFGPATILVGRWRSCFKIFSYITA